MIKNNKGFVLIEALIAVLITAMIAIVVAGMTTNFAGFTAKDVLLSCLVEGASSGIEAKRANPNISSMQIQCGNSTVNVSISGTPPSTAPATGSGQSACVEVVSTASIGANTKVLRDLVCTLPQ